MAERRLRTRYEKDMALLPSRAAKFWFLVLVAGLVLLPLVLRRYPTSRDFILTVAIGSLIASVGSLGLNLLSGFAGQISLGHAFFIAVGVFTGAVVLGDPGASTLSGVSFWGLGLPWPVAVLAGGSVAAVIGVLVGPSAIRLRGLYLSLVTLGLVFLGEFLFKAKALEKFSGAARGRSIPNLSIPWFGLSAREQLYYASAITAFLLFLFAKNVARSRVGRAFQATRDRDIAAEIVGVNVTWAKLVAFGLSSFYAGAAGVLFGSLLGHALAANFDLLLSVRYIAMIIIGGVGTILGSALGALFVQALPEVINQLAKAGILPVSPTGQGSFDVSTAAVVAFGVIIVVFLVYEPRGLYGLWIRLRNYWKAWPFSY